MAGALDGLIYPFLLGPGLVPAKELPIAVGLLLKVSFFAKLVLLFVIILKP